MGLYPVFLVCSFVFGLAVNSGDAVPRPDFVNFRPNGVLIRPDHAVKPPPFNGAMRKSGARGLIGDDVSWLAMLPLNAIETFINIPIYILQTVSEFTDRALRYFISAEVMDFIEISLNILFFPLRVLYWVITIPLRILWFFITVPFRLFIWILDAVQIIVQNIWQIFFGYSLGLPYQVNVLNKFLRGDIFGPIGRGVEELIMDVYNVIRAVIDWIFSSSSQVGASRQRVVNTLSDTLGHMIKTNRLLREAF